MKKKPAKIAYAPEFIGEQKPLGLLPYYAALAVAALIALLTIHGILCEVGFVDYGPLLVEYS